MKKDFATRYGPWALVAGASEGLGAEFATQLAARKLHLLLVARRSGPLLDLSSQLRHQHRVQVLPITGDLGQADQLQQVRETVAQHEVGLLVYNAACSPIGQFTDRTETDHRQIIAVNCTAPTLLAHDLGRKMVKQRRGGILLMTSMAGLQGTAMVAHYAASKAYLRILAEGLWNELHPCGVDVLGCLAGATSTPGFLASNPAAPGPWVPAPLTPQKVVTEALAALGQTPTCIPGLHNRLATFVMQRLFPRRLAVQIISHETRRMYRG